MRALPRLLALGLALAAGARVAHADDDHLGGTIIFARGASLYRTDPRGKGPAHELAPLPAGAKASDVRALRSDAAGGVLLADVGGRWQWMRLDEQALRPLPCADGPAQLAEDGACVLCGAAKGSQIVNLATGAATALPIAIDGARLAGDGASRRLIWADGEGVWAAPPGNLTRKAKVAPEPPLRHFLVATGGDRAVGVYDGTVFDGKARKPAQLLYGFALDGAAARRRAIRGGIPLEWSHDGTWVLIQDGASACLMRATGGQYKCWPGYTAVSLAPDGAYALVLGSRDRGAKKEGKKPAPPAKGKPGKGKAAPPPPPPPAVEPDPGAEPAEGSDGSEGEGEGGAAPLSPDVPVALPSGPLSLYRARLDGAFVDPPLVVEREVEGAAVWVPAGSK
jgi:hypothetical protein